MSQQQNPIERAVELLVFAPLGVAMFAKDTAPTFIKMFVSRGQTEVQHRKKSLADHANQYRAVGRFAVKYGGPEVRRTATDKIDGARKLAEETFTGFVVPRLPGQRPAPEPTDAPPEVKIPKVKNAPAAKKGPRADEAATPGSVNGSAITEPALAIPEYDQLSASQVVERLDGLTPSELDEVRVYELAHRGRNTILGKIMQLTA